MTFFGKLSGFASRLVLTSFSLGYLVSEGVLPQAVTRLPCVWNVDLIFAHSDVLFLR